MKTWCPWSDLTDSSIWAEPLEVRVMWITLLAKKDNAGIVNAADSALARAANLTTEQAEHALSVLQAPDPHSRNRDNEGRRIAKVEGGYFVLNHAKFRERQRQSYRLEYDRERQRVRREKAPVPAEATGAVGI